jgi:hypothetical protein
MKNVDSGLWGRESGNGNGDVMCLVKEPLDEKENEKNWIF